MPNRFLPSAVVFAVVLMSSPPVAAATGVPLPGVSGPVSGGVRTGGPQASAIYDLARYGYTEREHFIEGTATSTDIVPTDYAPRESGRTVAPGTKARYKTRMIVALPPREQFKGWAMVEWANVTFQQDVMFAFRTAEPDPMGGFPVDWVVAGGSSQPCGRLAFVNGVDGGALVDGYLMLICGAAVGEGKHTVVPATAPPALWVNSELEGRNVPGPDSTEFRIWEVAGSSHVGNYAMTQSAATIARDGGSVGGSRTAGIGWDEDAQRQYGEHAGRPCLNRFPLHYAMMAAAEALPTWIMTGRAPESARYERNGSELVRDGDGNMRGGVRLPPIDVPVATSAGADCPVAIMGSTDRFDPLTLARRYPSHDDYVRKMAAATSTALARGWMLEPEATELMRLAEAAPIPGPSALAVATPGTSGHR